MRQGAPWDRPMRPASSVYGVKPWHTWGRAIQVTVTEFNVLSFLQPQQVSAIARVEYKRPETWRFLFWATLDQLSTAPAPVGDVLIRFNLNIGVGQHFFALNSAASLLLPISGGPGTEGWTNQLVTNNQVLADGGTPFQGFQDTVTAQSIVVGASVFSDSSFPAGSSATVTVGAFFAPNVHVRPSWFNGIFKGEED